MFVPALLAGLGTAAAGGAAAGGIGLSSVLTGIGTIAGIGGSIMSGIASKESADYSAKVARQNAELARDASVKEQQRGDIQAQSQDMKNKALAGAQAAAQSASGVDVNVGSPVDVRESSQVLGRMDTLTTKNNSDQRAVALRNQAISFDNEAGLSDAKGKNALVSGFMNAGTSLIGGSSRLSSKWDAWTTPAAAPSDYGPINPKRGFYS